MSAIEVHIENSGDAQRLLQTLPSEMFEQVQQVLMNGAIRVAERARELVPVRTGHLLASIRPEIEDAEDLEEAFSPIGVVADAEYASFVEFGTSRMEAEPFMQPAIDEIEPEIMEEVDAILADLGLVPGVEEP